MDYRDPNDLDFPGPGQLLEGVGKVLRKISPTLWGVIVGVLLLVTAAATSYYQVEPDEVGVVQRFGKFVETTDPGPHFRIPFGIETVRKVPVQRQLKLEFGFRSAAPGVQTSYRRSDALLNRESMMLTGDLNVGVVEWTVQYKIRDPYNYLFKVRNVEETMRNIAESSMRMVVGDHSVNEVLTVQRMKIALEARELLQTLADRYDTGIDVQQVVLQDVNPPDPVKPAFNDVNEAVQEKERLINEAQAELNKVIPRARGEAEQAVQAAEGYAVERVNEAEGDATRFLQIYEEYAKAKDVTRRRMYLETMAEVLPQAGSIVIIDDEIEGMAPLLRMDQGSVVPAAASTRGGAR